MLVPWKFIPFLNRIANTVPYNEGANIIIFSNIKKLVDRVIRIRVRSEVKMMIDKFGAEYREHMRRTGWSLKCNMGDICIVLRVVISPCMMTRKPTSKA